MDYDPNHFLTDVFSRLVKRPGDPVRQLDKAVEEEIEAVAKSLRHLAQEERENLLTMAEEKRKNPREPAKTLWRYAGTESYDRRR